MKNETKSHINLTIDKSINDEFTRVAKQNFTNKSALIQDFIIRWTKENKKKEV